MTAGLLAQLAQLRGVKRIIWLPQRGKRLLRPSPPREKAFILPPSFKKKKKKIWVFTSLISRVSEEKKNETHYISKCGPATAGSRVPQGLLGIFWRPPLPHLQAPSLKGDNLGKVPD